MIRPKPPTNGPQAHEAVSARRGRHAHLEAGHSQPLEVREHFRFTVLSSVTFIEYYNVYRANGAPGPSRPTSGRGIFFAAYIVMQDTLTAKVRYIVHLGGTELEITRFIRPRLTRDLTIANIRELYPRLMDCRCTANLYATLGRNLRR